uniref:Uncharacterized protein n=1 Tax=Populus trichocarpa TaxID=3694 RepID=A0A2K2BIE4_POPTR
MSIVWHHKQMNAKYLDHIYKNHSNILESQSGLSSQILHPSFATACNPKLTIHCAAKVLYI